MTEAAFIRAIAAAGPDVTPRLVFADWLEDHGQPERAGFVRDQEFVATTPTDTPDRRVAAARAAAVERRFGRRWAGPAARHAYDWQFRGGFPDLLGLTADKLRRNAAGLFAHTPVRSLQISDLNGRIELLRVIPPDSGLDRLSLWGARLTPDHLPELAAILAGFPHLRTLSLSFNLLDAAAVHWFVALPVYRGLARLELGANPLSDAARDYLRAAFGDRLTFECEREDDYLYRIVNDDPFYNGVTPGGVQYVTWDSANGYEVARFDAAGNLLGIETVPYHLLRDRETTYLERFAAHEGTVRVKRFAHADGRGIRGLPTLETVFRNPPVDEFAHEVLASWLHDGEFAFGNCILNRAGEVTAT